MAERRLVFAHYFLWFGTPEKSGDWGNWKWNGPGVRHNPSKIRDGRHDIAAVDYPALGPYDSSDSRTIRRHIRWAKQGGIDFFTVDWYGPAGQTGSTPKYDRVDGNFGRLLNVCTREKFKATLCYEEKLLLEGNAGGRTGRIDMAVRQLDYALRWYGGHPGYLRIGKRPVIVVWGDHTLGNDEWSEIMERIRRHHNPVIVYSYFFKNDATQSRWYKKVLARKVEPPNVSGMYPWLLIGTKKSMFQRLNRQYARLREMKRRRLIDIIVGSVWPNFNDTGVHAWGGKSPRVIPDSAGLYEETWAAAIQNRADWISIATWNDWNEGSQIEPDVETGARRLAITRMYAEKFKKLR